MMESIRALPLQLLLLLLPLMCSPASTAAFVQTPVGLNGRGILWKEGGFGNEVLPIRSRHSTRAGEGTTMGLFSIFSSGPKVRTRTP